MHCIPDFVAGNSSYLQIKVGGSHFGNATSAVASFLSMLAGNANHEANVKGMLASYQRRQDEWVFQSRAALEEMKQIDKQIIAAKIRCDIAKKELDNHFKQVDNAQKADEFMHDKYTCQELYSWMSGQISNVYFSCYQLAYDLAKRAEKAFRHKLGLEDSNFIQGGYWDSLKKGLLAGEKLSLNLKRLEIAYLEKNERELEITKHVSLSLLDPVKLLDLKENGECIVDLPEALFDLDYPSHYMRQTLTFDLGTNQFPFLLRKKNIQIAQMDIFIQPTSGADLNSVNPPVTLIPPKPNQAPNNSIILTDDSMYNGMVHAMATGDALNPLAKLVLSDKAAPTKWTMSIPGIPGTDGKKTGYPVTSAIVKDVIIVCHYALEKS